MSKPKWSIDCTSMPGIMHLVFRGNLDVDELKAFVVAHNEAIAALGGRDYKVLADSRELAPLSPEAAELMEQAKRYSSRQPNFRGSAVLVSGATVALQHRRTSVAGGVIETELISHDEQACLRHLATVHRVSAANPTPPTHTTPPHVKKR